MQNTLYIFSNGQCPYKSIHHCASPKIILVSNQPVCSTIEATTLQQNDDFTASVQTKLQETLHFVRCIKRITSTSNKCN